VPIGTGVVDQFEMFSIF